MAGWPCCSRGPLKWQSSCCTPAKAVLMTVPAAAAEHPPRSGEAGAQGAGGAAPGQAAHGGHRLRAGLGGPEQPAVCAHLPRSGRPCHVPRRRGVHDRVRPWISWIRPEFELKCAAPSRRKPPRPVSSLQVGLGCLRGTAPCVSAHCWTSLQVGDRLQHPLQPALEQHCLQGQHVRGSRPHAAVGAGRHRARLHRHVAGQRHSCTAPAAQGKPLHASCDGFACAAADQQRSR